MALTVKKTEHNGAKHGHGYMTKKEAKVGSRKLRRVNFQKYLKSKLIDL